MSTIITREIAAKVLEVVDCGLVKGVGRPEPGAMCVEAAVCYAMGMPHGDDPSCVSRALRSLKITLNDKRWSSERVRAKGLRRLAIAQLGSAGFLDDKVFATKVAEMAIRTSVPEALRAAATLQKDSHHRAALLDAASRCEREGTKDDADAAYAAADAAAAYAYAAADATDAYAYAADADAAAAAAARDKSLADFAERVVGILIEMKAPGCQWLDLAPIQEEAYARA